MNKKKILIVDDEENFTKLVKLNLEYGGRYKVMTENSAKSAFNSVRMFKPDLILLDVIMPDMDGGSVANQIKSDEDLKDIPVVFLTAIVTKNEASSRNDVVAGRPFLAKPVTKEQLIDCIEKNLKKS